MSNKHGAPIQNKEDLDYYRTQEARLSCVVMDNDMVIIEGQITFVNGEAQAIVRMLKDRVNEDLNNTKSSEEKTKLINSLISLKVVPFRIH